MITGVFRGVWDLTRLHIKIFFELSVGSTYKITIWYYGIHHTANN